MASAECSFPQASTILEPPLRYVSSQNSITSLSVLLSFQIADSFLNVSHEDHKFGMFCKDSSALFSIGLYCSDVQPILKTYTVLYSDDHSQLGDK